MSGGIVSNSLILTTARKLLNPLDFKVMYEPHRPRHVRQELSYRTGFEAGLT